MSYNYNKNKVVSVNQLNHKAPEKSHATKELAAVQTGMWPCGWWVSFLCCSAVMQATLSSVKLF